MVQYDFVITITILLSSVWLPFRAISNAVRSAITATTTLQSINQ